MSYDAFATTFSQSRKNLRWGEIEYLVEYTKQHTKKTELSILDVGCGNGRFLETLENSFSPLSSEGEGSGVRAAYHYLGTDESKGMISEAQALHPDNIFQVLDMNNLGELRGQAQYDYIIFIASFHHLQTETERKQVLQSTKKLLAPGGVVMMTNWNLLGEAAFPRYEKSHKGNGDFGIKIGEHERYYHGFELHELERLFVDNGYEILENRVFEGGRNIISLLKAR